MYMIYNFHLCSLCHLAAREGEPIVRPTFYDFEADAAADPPLIAPPRPTSRFKGNYIVLYP